MAQYSPILKPAFRDSSIDDWQTWLLEWLSPVLPRRASACSICFGPGRLDPATAECTQCTKYAEAQRALASLHVISYAQPSGLTDVLAQVKYHQKEYSWLRTPLSHLVERWMGAHLRCIQTQFSNEKFTVLPVPSRRGATSEGHLSDLWTTNERLRNLWPIEDSFLWRNEVDRIEKQTLQPKKFFLDTSRVKGRNFLVFDDLYTSGASMNSVALRLKTAGAKRVVGLVIGRHLTPGSTYGTSKELQRELANGDGGWNIRDCRVCIESRGR